MKKISVMGLVISAAATLWAGAAAQAQSDWPTKPIRLLVGFSPGGPTDNVARILAESMSARLGQPVVVENKAGAAGNIAAVALTQAPHDGYTLLYNTSSIVIAPWVYKQPGFDPRKDFAPVGLTAAVPLVLATTAKLPVQNPKELIALLKQEPGKYNYASSGTGAIEHLTAAQLLKLVDADATHVPYKGTAPAQVDLIAGATQFTTTTLNTVIAPVQKGTLHALAVTSRERSPVLPDVPTVSESLQPGFESLAWQGIVAPAGTPPDVLQKLNAAINAALESTDVKQKLQAQGTITLGGSVDDYSRYIQEESIRWGQVVKLAGVEAR
ncbi:Bug family tripartite tricarboxylate transporter substrate binding protein [Bordetella petrii]|uniref:Bug family tripartite tricarboxylate transporter substrate binding protein n=1 Tax=Bordetella petrii TaxID=94624 RepID=UPI001E2F94D2|nr:tripartite tricarboxylate transporter substrate binding protein [Bordetella petrii]MCD0504658.1 tripartite tricarboxylate transporter substrate binding protein [Bordetella petrii]